MCNIFRCGNIISRYPGYTVACKGVGPGPPGTLHYGCCSQLVLFVAKDYQKQMELNVNSLALVASEYSLFFNQVDSMYLCIVCIYLWTPLQLI